VTLGTLSRRGAALDVAERREFVDMAVRQGTRLKELTEQLLLAARFEQAGGEPVERPVLGNLFDNAAKYAPGHGPVRLEATRFGLRLPLAEPTGQPPLLAYAASRR
jgi:hypothetical protein